jgi:hypothetical protein
VDKPIGTAGPNQGASASLDPLLPWKREESLAVSAGFFGMSQELGHFGLDLPEG